MNEGPVNMINLLSILKDKPWRYRLKIKNELLIPYWSKWLISPSPSFLEVEQQGPYMLREIEWLDIDATERASRGNLIKCEESDQSALLAPLLHDLKIGYIMIEKTIRITI